MSRTRQQSLFKSKIYCIDASSIINLFRHHGLPYPPYRADIFEGLWSKLDQIIKNRGLISHIIVFKEVSKRDDDAVKSQNACKNKKTSHALTTSFLKPFLIPENLSSF